MQQSRADYTLTFARLTYPEAALPDAASEVSQSPWFDLWKARLSKESQDWEASKAMMESANPGLIPRNHLVEQALQAAESGEMQPFENLCQKLAHLTLLVTSPILACDRLWIKNVSGIPSVAPEYFRH